MYATCLFCHQPLGRNESVEAFPVGARLAFDPSKGRLWVVCLRCERWNLTPLEERWEAIEQAEKLYRDTRRRASTDNIGLAKLRDGTTLVRIGDPLRPEFAAWRYGDQFGRRRRRQFLYAGAGIAAVGMVVAGGAVAGMTMGVFAFGIGRSISSIIHGNPDTVVAKIRTESRGLIHVRRRHLAESWLSTGPDGSLALELRFKNGQQRFEGPEAERIASIVVPKVNRFGGTRASIAAAVEEIDAIGSSTAYIERLASLGSREAHPMKQRTSRWQGSPSAREVSRHGLFAVPQPQRLALEMALHEEAERRALEGELQQLENAWRDAEEIAAISDDLLLPQSIDSALRRIRGRA
ncbi:MAG: hypothetical protein ACT4P7_23505 [Gemmatimonadaceae bacterium]